MTTRVRRDTACCVPRRNRRRRSWQPLRRHCTLNWHRRRTVRRAADFEARVRALGANPSVYDVAPHNILNFSQGSFALVEADLAVAFDGSMAGEATNALRAAGIEREADLSVAFDASAAAEAAAALRAAGIERAIALRRELVRQEGGLALFHDAAAVEATLRRCELLLPGSRACRARSSPRFEPPLHHVRPRERGAADGGRAALLCARRARRDESALLPAAPSRDGSGAARRAARPRGCRRRGRRRRRRHRRHALAHARVRASDARGRAATAADVLRRCRRRPRRLPCRRRHRSRRRRRRHNARSTRRWLVSTPAQLPAHARQYIRLSLIARGAAKAAAMRAWLPSTATCSIGSSGALAALEALEVVAREVDAAIGGICAGRRRQWRRSSTLCGADCRRPSTGVACAPLAMPTRKLLALYGRCRRAERRPAALRCGRCRAARRRPSCCRNSWHSQRWWARAPPQRPSSRV